MLPDFTLISNDIDGAELKRLKRQKYYTRSEGVHDEELMGEIDRHTTQVSVPAEAWERIFGHGKHQ